VTLGFFALVVNAVLLLIMSRLLESFEVSGFWTALFGSIVISLATIVLGAALRDAERQARR